jgi:hypothetical protein
MKAASLTDVAERRIAPETPRDIDRLRNGRRIVRNGWCYRSCYDDRFGVTPDRACHLPRFQPATGPHPVPTPLAPELRRAGGHSSIGLGAQPSQRLPVIEWMGRNEIGHDELSLLILAGATREEHRPAAGCEERARVAGKEELLGGIAIAHPFSASRRSLDRGVGYGGPKSGMRLGRRYTKPESGLCAPGRVHNPVKVTGTDPQLNGPIARRNTLQLSP